MKPSEFRKLIREEVRKVLKEETFYDKIQKTNPGWSKEKTLADFADEYDTDSPGDYEEHQEYLKGAEKMLDDLAKKKPSVKVGDLVSVYAKSIKTQCVGKIVGDAIMKGSYGFAGDVLPNKIPAWTIECYTDKSGFKEQTKRLNVKGKTYYYVGTLQYPQYEEGKPEAFTKL